MFSGGSRIIAPQYNVTDDQLTLRPYNKELHEVSSNMCQQVGLGHSNNVCMFEVRTALDCVMRNKVRKFGDIADNLGACKHHISNMKQNLSKEAGVNKDFEKSLDSSFSDLHYARKSFV
eukprot:CAMPEP_0116874238 /NCGR_PEP_ID=MMETSP0463-20121206/5675_1 /TAXON_ID=181622 /ORGANISM="Strombidinopsis sp, Strain SopsisLIS2011" /LENGTH=118 /DNA_ID=CAMNT_0004517633 /DNA_START=2037 /DNA_END=2393 /DNA_ORIENTATION=+